MASRPTRQTYGSHSASHPTLFTGVFMTRSSLIRFTSLLFFFLTVISMILIVSVHNAPQAWQITTPMERTWLVELVFFISIGLAAVPWHWPFEGNDFPRQLPPRNPPRKPAYARVRR